jgi:hypothetical protein
MHSQLHVRRSFLPQPVTTHRVVQTDNERKQFRKIGEKVMSVRKLLCAGGAASALICAASALPSLLTPHQAAAQSAASTNVVPESVSATIHARIAAIDPATRAVTLTGASGRKVTLIAGPAVRLEMLKAGDAVNAQYYRSVAFMVKPPQGGSGTPVSDDQMAQIIAQPAKTPGGIGVRLTKVSGTVVGIDMADHSVEVVDPSGGGIYTIAVTDPSRIAMLGSLKVGDTITAVISQALAVSIEPAPKSWF